MWAESSRVYRLCGVPCGRLWREENISERKEMSAVYIHERHLIAASGSPDLSIEHGCFLRVRVGVAPTSRREAHHAEAPWCSTLGALQALEIRIKLKL